MRGKSMRTPVRAVRSFNVQTLTVPIADYKWSRQAANQRAKAERLGATRIWNARYYQEDAQVPQYIKSAIMMNGYTMERLGGTTYKNTVFGLVPFQHSPTTEADRTPAYTERGAHIYTNEERKLFHLPPRP